MMNTLLIFIWIWVAMMAMSFWEAYVEGRRAWDKGKLGWKIGFGSYKLTAYHFFVFVVMWPLLVSLPLVVYGWNTKLFGILLSAYISGTVIEDFMWYVVNPVVKIKEFSPKKLAKYYPWVNIFGFRLPLFYIVGVVVSIISWLLIWK
jgi:hypothetical protein